MSTPLVIVGCGGFGREVLAIVRAINQAAQKPPWHVDGFVDDNPSELNEGRVLALGEALLGPVSTLLKRDAPYSAVIAIASSDVRRRLASRLASSAPAFPVLVHPDATICEDVILGEGSVVAAGARISTNVVVDEHVHVDQNATVGHDCRLGAFSRLNPQACVSGEVMVGRDCLVGASATILQGLRIGDSSTVGACACVVRDVSERATVRGVPAS